jgi:hypothetical protein
MEQTVERFSTGLLKTLRPSPEAPSVWLPLIQLRIGPSTAELTGAKLSVFISMPSVSF